MRLALDPSSPLPLYHQIAEALRYRIATGKLQPNAVLPSVRRAAELWGVNLHTVRRGYRTLADEGLVVIDGARGTRVAEGAGRAPTSAVHAFIERTLAEARDRHGLSADELVQLLAAHGPGSAPAVVVVECSELQCRAHAAELEAAWNVQARPWPLENPGPPPPGEVVATYFHYNEIRRRWPHRFTDIRFVAIHPDPALIERLQPSPAAVRGPVRLLVCELDEVQAGEVAADLSALLPPSRFEITTRVLKSATDAPAIADPQAKILLTPRLWAALGAAAQADPRLFLVQYVIKPEDLEGLGQRLGWSRQSCGPSSPPPRPRPKGDS